MESTTMSRDRHAAAPATARQRTRAGTARGPARGAPGPARPRMAPGTGPQVRRPGTSSAPASPRPVRRNPGVPRAPFVLLVLSLLGGGLICLLMINTTLGATSFQLDHLQQSVNARELQAQQLQNQLSADESDAKIRQEACQLGMRPRQQLEFLDLGTHRLRASAPVAASPAWCPRTSQAAR